MKFVSTVAALALFALAAGPASAADPVANPTIAPGAVRVNVSALNKSGENGTATLTQIGNDTLIELAFPDTGAIPQPAHIHTGSCAKLTPAPTMFESGYVGGKSTTTLKNVSLASLQNGNFAINVHKSTSDLGTYVACGDIPKS
jgi:opacity protein-like surface antigen